MSDEQKPDDFIEQNKLLLLYLLRHQLYLEGVRSYYAKDYKRKLRILYQQFAAFFGAIRYETLDSFTKAELNDFVRRLTYAQQEFYSSYTEQLVEKLKDFLAIDSKLTSSIFSEVTGLTPKQATDNGRTPLYGPSVAQGDDAALAALWSRIANSPIPANGFSIASSLNGYAAQAISQVQATVVGGYANRYTRVAVLDAIVGNPKNGYRDGLFAKFAQQQTALVATILQYVSATSQAAVGSVYFGRYQWVSVIDNRTTEICRSRDGNIYVYGEGPLPPAHYFCRSKDVPIAGDQEEHDIPGSFQNWLQEQPDSFLNDALGEALAKQVADGESFSLTDVPSLTPEEFGRKLPNILGD